MKTLYEAVFENEETVKTLIREGADIGAVGGHYGTALHAAAYKGDSGVV